MNFVVPLPNTLYTVTQNIDMNAWITLYGDLKKSCGNGFSTLHGQARDGILSIPAGTEVVLLRLALTPYINDRSFIVRFKIKTCPNSALKGVSFYTTVKHLQDMDILVATPKP